MTERCDCIGCEEFRTLMTTFRPEIPREIRALERIRTAETAWRAAERKAS